MDARNKAIPFWILKELTFCWRNRLRYLQPFPNHGATGFVLFCEHSAGRQASRVSVPPHSCAQCSICSYFHHHSDKNEHYVLRLLLSVMLQEDWSGSNVHDRLERGKGRKLKHSGNINTIMWNNNHIAPAPCNAWAWQWSHLITALGGHYLHPTEEKSGPETLGNFPWVAQPIQREARFEPWLSPKCAFIFLPYTGPD